MGRIIVSNNERWKEKLSNIYEKSAFKLNYTCKYMSVFDKLNINVENYYEISDSEVIVNNGTLVYKDCVGQEALCAIYHDYINQSYDISTIRLHCFGSFFVLIISNGKMIGFTDEGGTYAVYYIQIDDGYLITNTYYHVESITHQMINFNANIEECMEFCVLNNETPFKNVYRLMGNEFFLIDIRNNRFKVNRAADNKYTLKTKNFEDTAKIIKDKMVEHTSKVKLFGYTPMIFMTGGVDSRLSLASYLASSIRPNVCSWYGNQDKMNTKDEDLIVSQKLAEVLNLVFEKVDVDDKFNGKIYDDDFERYGELATIYGNNKKWFSIFENSRYALFEFGYFGEIIKGWELIDRIGKETINIDEFCRLYTNRQSYTLDEASTFDIKMYKKGVYDKIVQIAMDYNMNLDKLSKEDCMLLYYHYRLHADTKCCNLANLFGYCVPVLAQKELADMINQCPYIYKKDNRLNLYITKLIDNRLLEIPYFSHCKYMKLDKDSLKLSSIGKDKVKKILIQTIQRMGIASLLVKIKRRVIRDNANSDQLLNKLADDINQYPYFKDVGIIVNKDTFGYIPMAIEVYCRCLLLDSLCV